MAEYIDREAALDIVNGWRDQLIPTYGKNDEYVKCLETVAEHLESFPAADVRPVVLCRDCKHGQGEKMDFWNEYEGIECVGGVVHRKDWFCADGEKREN